MGLQQSCEPCTPSPCLQTEEEECRAESYDGGRYWPDRCCDMCCQLCVYVCTGVCSGDCSYTFCTICLSLAQNCIALCTGSKEETARVRGSDPVEYV